jgi:uncharacterized phage-associated protein
VLYFLSTFYVIEDREMFSEIKVTQMAAYLLRKRGGRMSYMKLIKLLYLAERQAMAKWGESMSGDKFVSMPHGPVLSETYSLISGETDGCWNELIKGEANYELSLAHNIEIDDLDELCLAEMKILDAIFDEFGQMKRWDIRNYTHNYCKEWQDPNGSSFPIKPEEIFRAVGKTESEVTKLVRKYTEQQQLNQLKSALV